MTLPTDPDDQAELRLEALRECLRTGDAFRRMSPGYVHDPLRLSWALQTWGDLYTALDQLQTLRDDGAITITDQDPKTVYIRLTPIGRRWAHVGDGREQQRRRRRILRFVLEHERPVGSPVTQATIADGLGLAPDIVDDDINGLRTGDFMSALPYGLGVSLTRRGRDVARDNWTDGDLGSKTGPVYNTHNYAPVQNQAFGNNGPTTQTTMVNGNQADIRQVLDELTEAIRSLDRSVEHRSAALAATRQVAASVDDPDRDPEEFADHWTWLGRFADGLAAAGAVGAPTTVKALYDQAEPLIRPLLQIGGAG